jgi:hypothetical protein
LLVRYKEQRDDLGFWTYAFCPHTLTVKIHNAIPCEAALIFHQESWDGRILDKMMMQPPAEDKSGILHQLVEVLEPIICGIDKALAHVMLNTQHNVICLPMQSPFRCTNLDLLPQHSRYFLSELVSTHSVDNQNEPLFDTLVCFANSMTNTKVSSVIWYSAIKILFCISLPCHHGISPAFTSYKVQVCTFNKIKTHFTAISESNEALQTVPWNTLC